ncbi:MFS transporter, partial [Gammaproteobacteria bacterium]|nr:MFS transporter [Gammaproteobacteria bacterium]
MTVQADLRVSDQWLVVLYSFLIQAVGIGIAIYCFATFSLPWLDEFGASRRDIMLTTFWLQLATGAISPFIGYAMDRFPIRRLVLIGLSLLLLSFWIISLSEKLWHIWLVYATVLPVATTLLGNLAGQTLVVRAFKDKRGMAFGISALGTNFGGLIFPLLAATWILDFGWRNAFLYLGVIAVLIIVPLSWFVFRKAEVASLMNPVAKDPAAAQELTTKDIFRSLRFWIPVIGVVPLSMSFGAIQFNLGGLVRDLGAVNDLGLTSQLTGVMVVCMMLGKLFYGGVGDRLDHRFLFWIANALTVVALAIVMAAETEKALIIGIIFLGLGTGGILPLLALTISSRFPISSFGRVMGLSAITIPMGALSPVLAGWSYDEFGTYSYLFIALMLVILLVVLMVRWLPKS